MSVQNGDVVILQIGGVQVGALVSNSQNMTADMLDKTNKDTPGIKQYDAGEDGWTLSVEALWDPAATEGFSEALGYLKAGTEITVKHGITAGDNWTGTGLVSSIDVVGPKNEISSYSLEIQGTGVQYGPELYTDANAISDPKGNEADATTGFTSFGLDGTGSNVFQSQSGEISKGTYAFEMDSNDTPTSAARIYKDITTDWGLVIGNSYHMTFDMRHIGGVSGPWSANLGFGNESVNNPMKEIAYTETTWESVSYDWVHTANHRYLVIREISGSNDGGCYFDNLSCREIL